MLRVFIFLQCLHQPCLPAGAQTTATRPLTLLCQQAFYVVLVEVVHRDVWPSMFAQHLF